MTNVHGTDVSFYQDEVETVRQIDFGVMANKATFTIIRAGQNTWVDTDFAYNWLHAKRAGLPRGSYWFYDSRASPTVQAELWAEQFKGDFGELPLFADFEENYGGAYAGWKNFRIFLERIKKLAITKEIAIYTGYYYWKEHVIDVGGDVDYFRQYPLWIARYDASSPLIPAPWTDWLFWQYTDKGAGALYGCESGNVDLNYFNGDKQAFEARFGLGTAKPRPLDTEYHTQPFEGADLHRVFRFGSWCSVAVITPHGKGFHVTPFNMRTTSQCAEDLNSQITINGGAHTAYKAIGLHVCEGRYFSEQKDYEPFCNFTPAQQPEIKYYSTPALRWNALAGKRMIVELGKVSQNNSAAWYEVHPRTLIGVDAEGRSILCTVDGRQEPYSGGVDLFQSAQIMIEFGAMYATDLDGGGSSTMVIQQPNQIQKVVNYPIDNGIVGQEREVGNHIAVFIPASQLPPETGGTMATQKGTATKGTVNIKNPTGSTIATIPLNGWVLGDYSTTKSDLINFTAWFRPTGEKMVLPALPVGQTYKASATNMTVVPYTAPATSPSASPSASPSLPPDTGKTFTVDVQLTDDETGLKYGANGIVLKEI